MSERPSEQSDPARTFTLLVNPASGGGAAPEAVVPVARLLREAGAQVEVTYSPGPRAMQHMVAAAVARGDVVVSVGGEGMLSSLAGAVSRLGGTLGLLPAGRGNDFARMLGLPTDPVGQARVLMAGEARRVDLLELTLPGAAGPRVLAGSAYAGVDARTAALVDRVRWLPLSVQYPFAAVRSLATYRPARYRVSVDGVVTEHEAATVVVANSGFYGKGMKIAPAASVTDGMLQVVVIGAASRADLIRRLPTVYDGRHVDLEAVHVRTGRTVELQADARTPVPVGGDGEALGALPALSGTAATVRVLPEALPVIC